MVNRRSIWLKCLILSGINSICDRAHQGRGFFSLYNKIINLAVLLQWAIFNHVVCYSNA